ncbi:MAG: hypothetical protein KJ052_18580, partial [Candidatus Hydrogenedentes bacterium]|nr:hypothetical protein [Candidatus Hydrogenedentota bacterium]
LTFICDGRLALSLAEIVLASFKDCDVAPLAGGPLGACAGVAIVHAHAPFSQAYDLAESLCAMAKARLRAANKTGDYALDWHVGLVRGGNISRLREDQSDAATGKPYILGHPDERLTWLWLDHAVLGEDASSLRGTMWAKRRNKVKELGDICMDAPDELDARLEKWKVVEPSLRLPEGLKDGLILDALELFDLHQPLRNGLSEETVHGSA